MASQAANHRLSSIVPLKVPLNIPFVKSVVKSRLVALPLPVFSCRRNAHRAWIDRHYPCIWVEAARELAIAFATMRCDCDLSKDKAKRHSERDH